MSKTIRKYINIFKNIKLKYYCIWILNLKKMQVTYLKIKTIEIVLPR